MKEYIRSIYPEVFAIIYQIEEFQKLVINLFDEYKMTLACGAAHQGRFPRRVSYYKDAYIK